MNKQIKIPTLFLVVLGGRTRHTHIELHDIRWVIGNKIEETYVQLRKEWFGDQKGLHIDSYVALKYIEGKQIHLNKKDNYLPRRKKSKPQIEKLWFVNLGGYKKNSLTELHHFALVVANTATNAKYKAKIKWRDEVEQKHKDDIKEINMIDNIDSCHLIESNSEWEITLIPDPQNRDQLLVPDWYGYRRIDKVDSQLN